MEAQLVHEDKKGNRLIIAVFIEEGTENKFLKTILLNTPLRENQEVEFTAMQLNPMELIPSQQNFYSFPGSLTSLPYTEGVQWIVMEAPITASPDEIRFFKNEVVASNSRMIQPLGGRPIVKYFT